MLGPGGAASVVLNGHATPLLMYFNAKKNKKKTKCYSNHKSCNQRRLQCASAQD